MTKTDDAQIAKRLEGSVQLLIQYQFEVLEKICQSPFGSLSIDNFLSQNYSIFKPEKALESLIQDERYFIWRTWAAVVTTRTFEYKSKLSDDFQRRRDLSRIIDKFVMELHDNECFKGLESREFGDLFVGSEDVGIELALRAADLKRQLVKAKAAVARAPQLGRPTEATQDMARRLAVRWHKITGEIPSVSHEIDGPRVGLFVDFLQAAVGMLQQPSLDGNVGVAAERAAAWFRKSSRS